MFLIRYRIFGNVDELKKMSVEEFENTFSLGGIAGDIEIQYGSCSVGLYREEALWEGAYGWDDIDYWICSLLDVLVVFQMGAGHVAFNLIEDLNRWLEFYRTASGIVINKVYEVHPILHTNFVVDRNDCFSCNEHCEHIIPFETFRTTILDTAMRFLHEIGMLNPLLLQTHMISSIAEKIDQLTQS